MNDQSRKIEINQKKGKTKRISKRLLTIALANQDITVQEVEKLFEAYFNQINNPSYELCIINDYFASYARNGNNKELLEWFIQKKAEINYIDEYSGMNIFLHAVAENPNIEIIKTLINNGANIYHRSKYNTSAMQFACMKNPNPDIITLLKQNGMSLSERDDRNRSLCMLATRSNNIRIIQRLKQYGASLTEINSDWSCLFYAAREGQKIEVVRYLLSELPRSYINAQDNRKRTPLMYAIEYCSYEVAELLLNAGAIPTISDQNGWTALHWTLAYDEEKYRLLQKELGKYTYSDQEPEKLYGLTIFEFACSKSRRVESLQILYENGIRPKNLLTCLGLAAQRERHPDMAKYIAQLIQNQTNTN